MTHHQNQQVALSRRALLVAATGGSAALITGLAPRVAQAATASAVATGVDYSWGRPSPAVTAASGYSFVCRYVSYDTTGKSLSASEAQALIAAGLNIVLVWENSSSEALNGYATGAQSARDAQAMASACGMPAGRPIYFAVDFDATPGQQAAIDSYFDGVASVLGYGRTGAYGGYYPIQRLFNDGKITWGWQTYAWSGGQWDSRAQLRQTLNGITVDGADCDLDEAWAADYGQWGASTPTGNGVPRQVYEAASNAGWRALPVSGSYGAVTGTAVASIALDTTKIIYTLNGGAVFEAASNAGWQNLNTGIGGAQGTALAALNLNGVKLIYTVVDGYVHEAASNAGWQNLNTGIGGVSTSSISVIQLNGVKYIYSIVGGYVYEASSANAWRNLNTGIPAGSTVAAITLNGTKIIYTVRGGMVYEAASNAGWQNLNTGISGVSDNALAAMSMAGVKYIYTSANGYIYEANSANAWRNLNSGVVGTTTAVMNINGVKLIYSA